MNYRHAFHAGNAGDVLKHVVLAALLGHLRRKPAPFCYVDTHAGRGRYDLRSPEARKTAEHDAGVGRLLPCTLPAALPAGPGAPGPVRSSAGDALDTPPEVADWLSAVLAQPGNAAGVLAAYPGSPLVALHLRRPGDRLVLVERHPQEAAALRAVVGRERHVAVLCEDGYAALRAHLPPKENRGVVLIDPPYESPDEWSAVVDALATGLQRWRGGLFAAWYPVTERARVRRLHDAVRAGFPRALVAELTTMGDDAPLGMKGSGMLVLNPPWKLDERLHAIVPWLHARLAPDGAGHAQVAWISGSP